MDGAVPAAAGGGLAAADASGARLVSMENVHAYGRPDGRVRTEDLPDGAHTRKGRLRARTARELLAAHDAGRVEVAIGRASGCFGPRGGARSDPGDRVFPAAPAGTTATVLGDPDQPHTHTYVPDIGEGLAVPGAHPDAPGRVWHLPDDPDTRTTRQLVDVCYRQAGRPRGRLRRLPPVVLRALGLVDPTMRELVEVQYRFAEPFVVDSSRITGELGVTAAPVEQTLAETLRAYRDGPGTAARRP